MSVLNKPEPTRGNAGGPSRRDESSPVAGHSNIQLTVNSLKLHSPTTPEADSSSFCIRTFRSRSPNATIVCHQQRAEQTRPPRQCLSKCAPADMLNETNFSCDETDECANLSSVNSSWSKCKLQLTTLRRNKSTTARRWVEQTGVCDGVCESKSGEADTASASRGRHRRCLMHAKSNPFPGPLNTHWQSSPCQRLRLLFSTPPGLGEAGAASQ